MTPNCRNCKNLTLIPGWWNKVESLEIYAHCKLDIWPSFNGDNRAIKLRQEEWNQARYKPRNIFNTAKNCNYFKTIDFPY